MESLYAKIVVLEISLHMISQISEKMVSHQGQNTVTDEI